MVRFLVGVLVGQLVLAGVLLWQVETDFALFRSGGSDSPARAAAARGRFDGDRAFALARAQVALGPRPAGSAASRRAAEFLRPRLPRGRFTSVPGGLRNVFGEIKGTGRPVLLIAHYDTTPVPGYLGANNSAAAVGAVVELSRALARERGPSSRRGVQFLLTDGEEAPTYPVVGDFTKKGLRGSRAAARTLRPAYVIVLDFVGNKGLRLPREQFSDAPLWARMRAAAARVGHGRLFPAAEQGAVQDDHLPFIERGVPSIDLIDFSYPCWQKTCDTLDKLDPAKLDGVGESVLELVSTLRG